MFINNFDPVAFSLFSLEIRWYSLAYIFGILFGWFYCKKILIQENKTKQEFDNLIQNLYSEKPPNYTFKVKSFKTAITIIRDLDFKIKNSSELKEKKIKGIGKGILDRIDEIINSGNLKENKTENKSVTNELRLLQNITGIGPKKAQTLVDNNITLSVLLNKPSEEILSNLTHHQKVGLKYYYDLKKKIPRKYITDFINILNNYDFKFTVCGSYRRGKDYSGDIDVLILEQKNTCLDSIISKLKKDKLLTDDLTNKGKTKYMGICKLPNFQQYMRIDIRLIPYESKGAAMLYFTGSGNFNKVMRTEALKKGYTINEYGIYTTKKEGKKMVKDELVPTESEEDIFKVVDMEYLAPKDRI